MASKFEKKGMKMSQEDDRRVKLTDSQKEEIIEKYETGQYSQRTLGNEYGVSKSLIKLVIHPEYAERQRERCKERRKDGRYKETREQRRETMRKYREHKRELYENGKLLCEEDSDYES